jgi:hypothetical protein
MRRYSPVRAALLAVALGAAACTDAADPTAPNPDPPTGPPGTAVTMELLSCSANRETLEVRCDRPNRSLLAPSYLVVGGQNIYVKVQTSNVNYNSGTGNFTFDASIRNLIPQSLGTTDGATLDPAGVRIFFVEGTNLPVVTGSGSVTVPAPDGSATFTAANQPYYQYNEVLSQYELSPARTWTLNMPTTVTSFNFNLLVAAAVQFPNGWIDVTPGTYSLAALQNRALGATVRSPVGNVDTTVVVSWNSADATTASVADNGYQPGTSSYAALASGVRAGPVAITATSGARSGAMTLTVMGIQRTWTGAANADWSNGANWNPINVVPAAEDTAIIPNGVPNFPALTASTTIGGVNVANNATLSLGAFDLTANANVATGPTVGNGILGSTGRIILAGTGGTVGGRLPLVRVTGSYSLNASLFAVAEGQVEAGTLESDLFELAIDAQ